MKGKICVGLLEDEAPQAELVQGWLADSGYRTYCCATGTEFVESIAQHQPDMVVLDWQLPEFYFPCLPLVAYIMSTLIALHIIIDQNS